MHESGWRHRHMPTWQPPDLDQPDLGCRSLLEACLDLWKIRSDLQDYPSIVSETLRSLAAGWAVVRGGCSPQGCPLAPPRDQALLEAAAGVLAAHCVPGAAGLCPRSSFAAAAKRCRGSLHHRACPQRSPVLALHRVELQHDAWARCQSAKLRSACGVCGRCIAKLLAHCEPVCTASPPSLKEGDC